MENAIFTTLCMLSDGDGRILLQERRGTNWDGFAFPGGHVEKGESFTESVIREVKEETGYTVIEPRLCGIKHFPTADGCRYVILLFMADRFHGELRSSEEGTVSWVNRAELGNLNLARDMREMLEIFEGGRIREFYCREENGKWESKLY